MRSRIFQLKLSVKRKTDRGDVKLTTSIINEPDDS